MSSFLDFTGLSELVTKLKSYFAKKDGTYPNMTVGTATTATDYNTSTGTIKSGLANRMPINMFNSNYVGSEAVNVSGQGYWYVIGNFTLGNWFRKTIILASFSEHNSRSGIDVITFEIGDSLNVVTKECDHFGRSGTGGGGYFYYKYKIHDNKLWLLVNYQVFTARPVVIAAYGWDNLYKIDAAAPGDVLYTNTNELDAKFFVNSAGQVGSSSIPVYVKSDGSVAECTDIGKEFWIDGTGGSAMYKTIGSIEFNDNGYLSQLCMEIGPLGTMWNADSQASKIIVKLSCYGRNYKLNVLAINYSDITSRCSFDTYKADNRVYIVIKMVAYGVGAYAKVVSHGERSWTAGVSYSAGTAPTTLDGGAYVTYKYAKINTTP